MTLEPEIFWSTDGRSSCSWNRLNPAPSKNLGFEETASYAFLKPSGNWLFYVDDEPLRDDPTNPSCWAWHPGFYAGEVTAEAVECDGPRRALFLLDVAPDRNKLGRDVFADMIREILDADPALVVGTEPASVRAGALGTIDNAWVAFSRLRRYVPDFLKAFSEIRERPRVALRVSRESVALHRVRSVDRQTISSARRNRSVAALLGDAEDLSIVGPDVQVDVPRIAETTDSAANRTLLALVLALSMRTKTVIERVRDLTEREERSDTRTPLVTRWPRRHEFLDHLAGRLRQITHDRLFREVERPEISAAGLTAISADALYSRAWSRGWLALRPGIASKSAVERLWISPSWEIYERWCFIRLGKMLATAMPEWNWHLLRERWVGSFDGSVSELMLQPTFRSWRGTPKGRWSISKQREPDLVLLATRNSVTRFLVLDAKYRTSRTSVLDAMESAHVYQDSLRIGSQRPHGSILLVPRGAGAGWLENVDFQMEHRVGVAPFSPGTDNDIPLLAKQVLAI